MNEVVELTPALRTRARFKRENASGSTARSPQSACRNVVTGQVTVMRDEDRREYNKFCSGIIAGYAPENPLELQIAYSIAENEWRLNRAAAIEENIFSLAASAGESATGAYMRYQRSLASLSLYKTRLRSAVKDYEKRLKAIQTDRIRSQVN